MPKDSFEHLPYSRYIYLPFIHYSRSCMDWTFSDSPLSLAHWNYVEEIYKSNYNISFWRHRDKINGTLRGKQPRPAAKTFMTCVILFVIVVIPVVPQLIMVTVDKTMVSSPVEKCKISLSIANIEVGL